MRVPLVLHPDSTCAPVRSLYVEVDRLRHGRHVLRYVVEGDVQHIRFGHHVHNERVDELWRHTCFEAFVQVQGQTEYLEFNFATDGWNCYQFDDYREGMKEARIPRPRVETGRYDQPMAHGTRAHFTGLDTFDAYLAPFVMLQAQVELKQRTELWMGQPLRLGLSAVIEEHNGNKSYWALRHPQGKPDFHRSDCFALELPAARPA